MDEKDDKRLVISSASFLLVAVIAYYKHIYIYMIFWILLCITSIAYHKYGYMQEADKIMVVLVVFVGLLYYIRLVQSDVHLIIKIIPLVLFVFCIVSFYKLHLDHIFIHIASIIGHIIIIVFTQT